MHRSLPRRHRLSHRLLSTLVLSLILYGCGGESSSALVEKAQHSLAAGDRKAAVILLKSAIQEDEDNTEARFRLGKLQLELGDYASAEKELKLARQGGYATDKVNPLLARALIEQGEFRRVQDELPIPEKGSRDELPMLIAHATAQLGTGDKEGARGTLVRAAAVAPTDTEVLLAQAQFAAADGDLVKAHAFIDEAVRNAPEHRDAWLFKADLLRIDGKLAEAAKAYQTALRIDPGHHGARLALASIAITENRLADARSEVETVLKADRNHLQARYSRALIEFREGKYALARDHLAAVLKQAPGYLPAVLLAGSIEYAAGNMQIAESHLNKVVKANPRNLYALRLLAAAQLRQGRPDVAAQTLAGIPPNANDVGLQVIAGEIALARKEFAKAAEHFEKAASIQPDNADIRTELGAVRLARGDARAMDDLRAAAGMTDKGGRADILIIANLLQQQKFDAALTSIASLEKKQQPSPLTLNYRGIAHLGKKEPAAAREQFGKALQLDPGFFPAAVNLARLDLQDNNLAAARQRFEAILKADPKHLEAMLALADLSLRSKDTKNHVAWLEKASRLNPQAPQPRVLLTRYWLAAGEQDKALASAREAADAHPDNPVVLEALGSAQFAAGDTTNALGSFRKLAEIAPGKADPLLKIALVQRTMRDLPAARKSLQDALRIQPDFLEAQMLLGGIAIEQGRFDEALEQARHIQQQKPGSPAGFVLEADAAFARKDYAAALAANDRAFRLAPSGPLLTRQLPAFNATQRAAEGEKRLADWLAKHPQDAGVRLALAENLIQRGQHAAAIDHYLTLNKHTPGNLVVLNNLAWSLSEMKDPRALTFAEQALKLKPDNPAVMDTLGWVLVQQGQAERGIKLLQQALSKVPDSADTQWHLAVAYARNGDRSRARGELERLLASGQTFRHEQEARALLSQLRGQPR